MKSLKLICMAFAVMMFMPASSQRKLKHPGISYTQADIDRMKAMIAARQEPFYSGFLALKESRYTTYKDISRPLPVDKNGDPCLFGETLRQLWFEEFGNVALNNALMWHLTGDDNYADRAVIVLNRYNGVHSTWSYGTSCLDNGACRELIEAAELIRDYGGWKPEDQQAFKDFLVHPGYSTVENYSETKRTSVAETNQCTVYWNIFNGDPDRHGNQGLYGLRTLMAMGIYLDNDTIYDRALRKLLSLPHRPDDLPYPGKNVTSYPYSPSYQDEYYETWTLKGEKTGEDWGADDELKYWIYDNGQCQESSRDQGHIIDGLCNFIDIARTAWNQGDDLYTQFDDRLLKGIIFTTKYNYGYINNVLHNELYWQGEELFEPTVENGQFYKVLSRNQRWLCKKICPWSENGQKRWSRGTKRYGEPMQFYIDYKVRIGRSDDSLLWVKRAYDMDMDSISKTGDGRITDMLLDYRTAWMAGDGGTFDAEGRHVSGLPAMPGTLKAVDYDYYNNVVCGNGMTYYNPSERTDRLYRAEGGMQIAQDGGDYVVTELKRGAWMSYTVVFPKAGRYRFRASGAATDDNVRIGFAVDGSDVAWSAFDSQDAVLKVQAGARVIRVYVDGADDALQLKTITVEEAEADGRPVPYVWDSRDYRPVSGKGSFLTDAGSHNLYSTAYGSAYAPSFTIDAADMNYSISTANRYLLIKGQRLNSAGLSRVVYRTEGSPVDVTKSATTPQVNHRRMEIAGEDSVVLVWKLDSTINSRIKPLFKDCYSGNAESYTLRGLTIAVTGTNLYRTTSIDEIGFYDEQSLYAAYPMLDPTYTAVRGIEVVEKPACRQGVYDLAGRKVPYVKPDGTGLKKGFYIRDGKKLCVSN